MTRLHDLALHAGGLWHKIALQLQVGPVATGVLFLRIRDLERPRAAQRNRYWRALDLMARADLITREAGCAFLTAAGREALARVHADQLLAAWSHCTDTELELAIADAPDPDARACRKQVLELRLQQRQAA